MACVGWARKTLLSSFQLPLSAAKVSSVVSQVFTGMVRAFTPSICNVCGSEFATPQELWRHRRARHAGRIRKRISAAASKAMSSDERTERRQGQNRESQRRHRELQKQVRRAWVGQRDWASCGLTLLTPACVFIAKTDREGERGQLEGRRLSDGLATRRYRPLTPFGDTLCHSHDTSIRIS